MANEIKIFNMCDHMVEGKLYDMVQCPKCNGKGYYYDVNFNSKGEIKTCTADIKLQQEVLKIMNDPKFGNIFHPKWGNILVNGKQTSSKNLEVIKQKIQMSVYETLIYLRAIQINNQAIFGNMSNEEIIQDIKNIDVEQINVTSYIVKITFSNMENTIFTQEIII